MMKNSLSITFILFFTFLNVVSSQPQDILIANRIFSKAFEHKMIERSMGDIITFVGKQFIGSSYEANTLDRLDSEQLLCNLTTFDCVTFVENVLAISRCIKENRLSYDAYRQELQIVRYRNGIMNGYASRLHYFSDWIYDNEKKGIVDNITKDIGGIPCNKAIDFMSKHRSSYPKLSVDSTFKQIKMIEDSLNTRQFYFLPKSKIKNLNSKINNGDLIAITTSTVGLDISHTGIALRMKDGSLHYMHAPDVEDTVRISKETLSEYIRKHNTQTGIMVIRAELQ